MIVIDYLKNNTLSSLREKHGVRFNVQGHLVTLAYDQFEGSISDPIACLCRGMVITDDDFIASDSTPAIRNDAVLASPRILAFPFVRFFNYGQVDTIFNPSRVYEKLDGTMIVIYFDDRMNMWQVATRNVPNGSNTTNGSTLTFRDLVLTAVKSHYGYSPDAFFSKLNKKFTYIFELTTPENQVVVRHNNYKLTLIGCRDNISFAEQNIECMAEEIGVESVTCHFFKQGSDPKELFEKIVGFANSRDATKHEGFVIVGENWERIKIKSDEYSLYNRAQDLSQYDILNLILLGKIDDFLPMMPDYKKNEAAVISDKLSVWIRSINQELKAFEQSKNGLLTRRDVFEYLDSNKYLCVLSKTILRAYTSGTAIVEASEFFKQGVDATTGQYQTGFLRSLNNWIS